MTLSIYTQILSFISRFQHVELAKVGTNRYKVYGFYKSGDAEIDLDLKTISSRYDRKVEFFDEWDLVPTLLSEAEHWFNASAHKLESWSVRDPNWQTMRGEYENFREQIKPVPEELRMWTLDSSVLGGFYVSAIIVLAAGREAAITTAVQAFKHHVQAQLEEYEYATYNAYKPNSRGPKVFSLDASDPNVEKDIKRLVAHFEREATDKVQIIAQDAVILRRS